MFLLATSPIASWDGAGAFYTYGANSGGALFWFWVSVILCIVPVIVAWRAEGRAEKKHNK